MSAVNVTGGVSGARAGKCPPPPPPRQQAAAIRGDRRVPGTVPHGWRGSPSHPAQTQLPHRGAGARSRGSEQRLRARCARGAGRTARLDRCRCRTGRLWEIQGTREYGRADSVPPDRCAAPALISIGHFKGRARGYGKKLGKEISSKEASFSLLTISFRLNL